MTVSTSGIEPAIRRFAEEPIRPKLALSLNASNDAVRRQIMPVTRKWKIAALLDALRSIPFGKREYVTFEYVLLGGENDSEQNARELVELLRGLPAKVNLIALNPGPNTARLIAADPSGTALDWKDLLLFYTPGGPDTVPPGRTSDSSTASRRRTAASLIPSTT